jgi:DNA modification methylase
MLDPYLRDADVTLYQGDALDVLRAMPAESVHCCVTSPPYWGLRNYSCEGQLGLEPTPDLYVTRMVEVFREVRRVLRADGTLWLNVGDSYAAARSYQVRDNKHTDVGNDMAAEVPPGLKPKDLVGIPWRLAFALQADGWYLRSDIIWAKPNSMPESVTDRPTKAHEYVFLLSRSPRYFFDAEAVREPVSPHSEFDRPRPDKNPTPYGLAMGETKLGLGNGSRGHASGRNIRSVWDIATQPYPEAHFATFPEELVRRCILAGTSERGCCPECGAPWEREIERESAPREVFTQRNAPDDGLVGSGRARVDGELLGKGQKLQAWRDAHPPQTLGWRPSCTHNQPPVPCTVLDPFIGSGTTGLVARKHGSHAIGIELSPDYCELASRRLAQQSLLTELV